MPDKADKAQIDKFKDAAREIECDDGDQRFRERIAKLAKLKPKIPESKGGD